MANCGANYKYRVYMSGILVFAARTRALGSKVDIIALVSFKPDLTALPAEDLALLAAAGVKLKYVASVWDRYLEQGAEAIPDAPRAAEKSVMYNKIFAWELVEYDLVQYVDADVMPIGDMDTYFDRNTTTFINGWMSPLQGGWYLLRPSLKVLKDLVALVQHRYSSKWDVKQTFDLYNEMPPKERSCLDDDQGLFYCYFKYAKKFNEQMDYVVGRFYLLELLC